MNDEQQRQEERRANLPLSQSIARWKDGEVPLAHRLSHEKKWMVGTAHQGQTRNQNSK